MVKDARIQILLVEDEALLAMSWKLRLEELGYSVRTADTGEGAVATVATTPGIDLILMDLDLGGGLDGTEAAEVVLKGHDIPIIFVSGHSEGRILAKMGRIPAYGYVAKSSPTAVLDASIEMALRLFGAGRRMPETCARPEPSQDGILAARWPAAKDAAEAEEALRESEERLSFVIQGSKLGYSDNDLTTGRIRRNERWAEMLGYTLREIGEGGIKVRDLIHPDDQEEAERITREHLEGKTDHYRMKYRLRTKGGQYRWILDCGKVVKRDADGKPVRVCGTHQDITEEMEFERGIEALLSQKELILKETHHRIKNNLNTVCSLLALQARALTEASAKSALVDTGRRVQSMAALYDKLYQSTGFTELPVKDYLADLVDEIVANFPNSQRVRVEKRLDQFVLDTKRIQPLGIIINELLTNIMKYAFEGRERGLITVWATKTDGHIAVRVEDDGVGMPESAGQDGSKGFGLLLVQALAAQLQGKISIEGGKGSRVIVEFEA